jgi:hypothetical protein
MAPTAGVPPNPTHSVDVKDRPSFWLKRVIRFRVSQRI